MFVVAQQTTTNVLDTSTPVGVAVLVCAVVAAGIIAWLRATTGPGRVRPGPQSMELRPETPALVDLLTGGFEVEDDAVPATVVDLAARGWLTIESVGGDRVILRLRARQPDDALTAYEQRVMRHIERHQTDGVVPAPVLTLGPEGVSQRWFRGFVREVTAHGRELGLCRRRWDLRHLAVLWAAVALAVAPAWLAASAVPRIDDPTGWGSVGNLLLGLAIGLGAVLVWVAQGVTRSDAQTDTPAGREAAAHWLGVRDYFRESGQFADQPAAAVAIWDRNLAHATAMGLAPLVQRQLPFETEHDRHAWSLASGHWRRIKVSYRAPRPSWGDKPLSVAFRGLVQAVVTGFLAVAALTVSGSDEILDQLTADQRRGVGLAALVVAILAAGAFIIAVIRFLLGVSDLFASRTVEGEVVRRRAFQEGHRLPKVVQWLWYSQRDSSGVRRDQHRATRYHLAIDPGDVDLVRAFRVTRAIHDQVQQGARVRAQVTPRLGYVKAIETLAPPRASAASEPGVLHPLAAEAVDRTTQAVTDRLGASGGIAGAFSRLEAMTDEQGRSVLDQTDDDGVSLRERMAESQGRLDEVMADPRVASNPLLGSILGAIAGSPPPPTEAAGDEPGDDAGRSAPEQA
ncbi:MAG TPA: hypothetical protein VK866_15905 [Acidimicrobiales bacterium]|nr:hypothetical protein [Acidimicrobiales bacterium]